MKKLLLFPIVMLVAFAAQAQIPFPTHIDTAWSGSTIWFPQSPLKTQNIFIGGVDSVQTTGTYGNAPTTALSKSWNDFIGFVPDTTNSGDLGWVLVNHERIQADDRLGDGGGMTSFKIKRVNGDSLVVVDQQLADGREGKFFNVDFANTVGETGMNCGGIKGDNRIWTAEEWFQGSNPQIYAGGNGFTDTTDFKIGYTKPAGFPGFNGEVIRRFENLNWMVEVDPRTGKAVRKQYNWGRAGWEGGVVMPDNKTVYLFEDGTPGILAKFVAVTAGDFTDGQLYVYKHDLPSKWISIPNDLNILKSLSPYAVSQGATMFNRLEWGTYSKETGKIYIAETGRDGFASRLQGKSGVLSPTLIEGYKNYYKYSEGIEFSYGDAAAADSVMNGAFPDYYGRVLEFDPVTDFVGVKIHGGPLYTSSTSQSLSAYPSKHMSNPDGLETMTINGKDYLIIQEDLNGRTYNRMPAEYSSSSQTQCELWLLDLSIANPSIDDLQRLTACPPGAEITGACVIDEKTILFNIQHPHSSNTFPYNNSMTIAITGFDGSAPTSTTTVIKEEKVDGFSIYPNPATREFFLNKKQDIAVYSSTGQRMNVYRNIDRVDVNGWTAGMYIIQNNDGETLKLIIQ